MSPFLVPFLVALVWIAATLSDGTAEAARKTHKRRARPHHRRPAAAAAPAPAPPAASAAPEDDTAAETPTGRPRRVMLTRFTGLGAQLVHAATTDALQEASSVELVPLRVLDDAQLDGDTDDPVRIVEAARRLNLTVWVRGKVTRLGRRSFRATLTAFNGEDGQTLGQVTFQARTLVSLHVKLRDGVWAQLKPLVDQAASPGPSPTPAPTPPPTPTKVKAPPKAPPRAPEASTEEAAGAPPKEPEAPAAEDESAAPSEEGPSVRKRHLAVRVSKKPSPGAEASDQDDEGDDESGPPPSPSPARAPCSIMDLELAGGVLARMFNYRDEDHGALRAYTLFRAPGGRLEGTIYPFAGRSCGAASGIGLRLGYERMAPVISRVSTRELATTGFAYDAALVLRIRLGALTLVPSAGYFGRRYTVEGGVVPNIDNQSVGGRLDVDLRLGLFLLEIGGGGRYLLASTDLQSAAWFPGATGYGVVARGRIGVEITDWLALLAGAYGEYWAYKLNIAPGGAYPNGAAAGAYDLHLQAMLSLRFRIGGGGRGAPPK